MTVAEARMLGAFLRALACYLGTQAAHFLGEFAIAAEDLGGRGGYGCAAAAQLNAANEALYIRFQ